MPELYFLAKPVSGLEFTIELIGTLVPCEAISACLYDINTDEFRFVALSGTGAAARRASAVASQAGLFGVAKRAPGEALVVASAAADARFDRRVDGREELEVRSLVYLPVRFGGQLLGMLQLINRTHSRPRSEETSPAVEVGFTPADVAVLTYVTTQLAEFLLSRRSLG
jgi:GAF domain-containing protein